MNNILENLNSIQQKAVTSDQSSILVLAGAGSGKTRVLIHRMAWLMREKNISPYGILAVTFTNKAAHEMRNRIEQLMQMPAHHLWIGTFHGLAHRLLRLHWKEAELPESFQIMDSEDQLRLIKRVMKQLNLDEELWAPKKAQWYINQKKEEGVRAKAIVSGYDVVAITMKKIYLAYEAMCEQGGLVDFAELLLRANEVFSKNPSILNHYRERFSHILVDEFQDTNTIQYAWIRMLSHPKNNIMIVGDDDQSIYGWRGAKIENIYHFQKDYKNAEIIRLEQNYRSTGTILKAANALIDNNVARMGKNLWTELGNGDHIYLYQAFNDRDEAFYIASQILHQAQQGNAYNDFAILYRSNAQSRILEEQLIQLGIPYRIYGGLRFFDRQEIRDAIAYLCMLNFPDNDAAFDRIINVPTRGIGQQTISSIREYAQANQLSLWKATKKLLAENQLSSRSHSSIESFVHLIQKMQEETSEMALDNIVEHVIYLSGLIDHYKKEKSEKGNMRVENLAELISAARQFEIDEEDQQLLSPLPSFLANAALESGEKQEDDHKKCVQLMTLHSAKGLEFPVVFLSGMEDGLFPHKNSIAEENVEEERRLCYVGITRAMKKLFLTYAMVRRLHGYETMQMPSRFLQEIPEACLNKKLSNVKVSPARAYEVAPFVAKKISEPNDTGYSIGQSVFHEKFGDGVILELEGSGDKARITVRFKRAGTKVLIAGLAKLK